MLDIAQNLTVDRLIATPPGERIAVASECGKSALFRFHRSGQSRRGLSAQWYEHDECVAVIVPRSPEPVVAIHGIMRAGAAYVPIDPRHPSARIRTIIQESGARHIVACAEYTQLAEELGVRRVEPTIAGQVPSSPWPRPATWPMS